MVLTRSRDTQMDKARRTMREVVKYAQEAAQDERLRSNVSSALAHGANAGDRLKKDIDGGAFYSRLATDKKLRKSLRAMLDDLEDASDRVRGKKTHRFRNVVLTLAGIVGVVVTFPKIRPWLSERTGMFPDGSKPDPVA